MLVLAAFSFCINLLALASPLYMLQLYDRVLSSRSIDTLVMLTIIVIAALGMMSLLDGVRRLMLPRIAAWFDDRLGPAVLRSALDSALDGDDASPDRALRDLDAVRAFLGGAGVMPLMDIPWTPLFIAALFILDPLLGAIGAGSAVLLFGLGVLNELATRAPLADANSLALRNQRQAETTLRNAEVIRAMGLFEGITAIWQGSGNRAKAAQLVASDRGAVILAISKFCRLAVQTLIMGAGAWLVIKDNGSAGTIFASSFLLSRALAPVEGAIATWKSLVTARLAYRRLIDLSVRHPAPERGMELAPPDGKLAVERLVFVPPGAEAPTLRGVSFGLSPGEVLGIVGPSAAGKSTLARLVAGTWRPAAGHVRLDGADISVWHDSDGSRHIGYLPQDVELFAGTVRDNIARFQDADPAAIVEAAKLVGVHETIMRLPRGYDCEIGDAGVKLSGGQRQRLGLARAVFGAPRLVILDEPNSSLDHEGENALHEAIAHLKSAGTTVLIITHRASVLGLADKLLLLRDGAVQAYGGRTDVVAAINAAAAGPRGSVTLGNGRSHEVRVKEEALPCP
jgi:PrtD family type I secretion system ABC transporter